MRIHDVGFLRAHPLQLLVRITQKKPRTPQRIEHITSQKPPVFTPPDTQLSNPQQPSPKKELSPLRRRRPKPQRRRRVARPQPRCRCPRRPRRPPLSLLHRRLRWLLLRLLLLLQMRRQLVSRGVPDGCRDAHVMHCAGNLSIHSISPLPNQEMGGKPTPPTAPPPPCAGTQSAYTSP